MPDETPALDITGDTEEWWGMLERGDFAVIWEAQQQSKAREAAKRLALDEPETAELMRLRPTLDASDD